MTPEKLQREGVEKLHWLEAYNLGKRVILRVPPVAEVTRSELSSEASAVAWPCTASFASPSMPLGRDASSGCVKREALKAYPK